MTDRVSEQAGRVFVQEVDDPTRRRFAFKVWQVAGDIEVSEHETSNVGRERETNHATEGRATWRRILSGKTEPPAFLAGHIETIREAILVALRC